MGTVTPRERRFAFEFVFGFALALALASCFWPEDRAELESGTIAGSLDSIADAST